METEPVVDLLFTDIVMPGEQNGHALARWASQRRPGLKVRLTTRFSGQAHDVQEAGQQAFSLLRKPYAKERLARAVRATLDGGAI